MAKTDPLLQQFLERLNTAVTRKVTVVIIGGNALTLLGLKDATADVDIVYRTQHKEVGLFCKEYKKKYGVKVDVFLDGLFKSMRIKDYLEKATPLELKEFPNLDIRVLNIYDIIITKIDRWSNRDIEDIAKVLKTLEISQSELDNRLKYIRKFYMGPKEHLDGHYSEFNKIFGNQLHP